MTSTQHSEEAWAVVIKRRERKPYFATIIETGEVEEKPRLFGCRDDAMHACVKDRIPPETYSIQRVCISTLGRKGAKRAKR